MGSNNVPTIQSGPEYNNSTIENTPNQSSPTAIKAYNAFIPEDYALSDEHPQIPIPSTIEDKLEELNNNFGQSYYDSNYFESSYFSTLYKS
jgi:hypothetical protein